MSSKEIQAKVRKIDERLELKQYEKIREMELEMDYENRASNRNRSRSISVGTAFGGTTEIMMRGDGGRHLWCAMQPVEVIELINQLAANVGCNVSLVPRKDFASWRDWRVSEAEKKHLNGHVPFVNDMAVFQRLGASGYDDEEAKRIMDILANVKEFANENIDTSIKHKEEPIYGAPNAMFGEEDGLLHNKLALDESGDVLYVAGGNGGDSVKQKLKEMQDEKNAMAAQKTVNKRTAKRATRAS